MAFYEGISLSDSFVALQSGQVGVECMMPDKAPLTLNIATARVFFDLLVQDDHPEGLYPPYTLPGDE